MSLVTDLEMQGAALDARLDQVEAELAEIESRRRDLLGELAEIKHANAQLWTTYNAERNQ